MSVTIDGDFPGGNIILESIDGDKVALRQDLRDTEGNWFYWYFRVRGAQGRRLRFQFTAGSVVGVVGPACSTDNGLTWEYLGAEAATESSFDFDFSPGDANVRFCLAVPYLQQDMERFLQRHASSNHLKAETLCVTRQGRQVERLTAGRLDGRCKQRILLTARHHCCEMTAGHALEGLLEEVVTGTSEEGRWLRDSVEVLAIPFMDKDGVENGDQGKNRRPHDHNRDYITPPIYPPVAALMDLVGRWSRGKLRLALDLHCPTLRGGRNECVYFVGGPDEEIWHETERLAQALTDIQRSPGVYHAGDNLPFGQDWNNEANYAQGRSFGRWAATIEGIKAAATIEIAYSLAHDVVMTPKTARGLGRDLARAIGRYLRSTEPKEAMVLP